MRISDRTILISVDHKIISNTIDFQGLGACLTGEGIFGKIFFQNWNGNSKLKDSLGYRLGQATKTVLKR